MVLRVQPQYLSLPGPSELVSASSDCRREPSGAGHPAGQTEALPALHRGLLPRALGEENMGQRIRVLIADDHPRSRKGLRALLSTCPAVEVIGAAQDGREAVQLVEECQPDVVLMDIQMPIWDGLQATRVIKAHWPEVRVIILTIRTAGRAAAISAGADGFLLKGCPSEALFAEIQGDGDTEQEPGSAKSWSQSGMPPTGGGIGQRNSLKIALSTS